MNEAKMEKLHDELAAKHERIKVLEEQLEFRRAFESEMRKDRDHLRARLQEAAKLNMELQAKIAHLQAQISEQVSLSFVLHSMLRKPEHIPQYRVIVAACFPDWTLDHVNQFIDSALGENK